MGKAERDKLRAEVDKLSDLRQGGYSPHQLSAVLTRSVLLLDETSEDLSKSSEKLARWNIALTGVILFVAIVQLAAVGLQIWLEAHPKHPNVRFVPKGNGGLALDNKAGLWCETQPVNNPADGHTTFGQTTIGSSDAFVPYCTDLYLNEDRVLKDFADFIKQKSQPPSR